MGTLFEDIYALNQIIKSDGRINAKPLNLIYQLYFQYLSFAISYFSDDCYKDLDNIIPFSMREYEFTGNGVDNKFILDTAPPTDCKFYISVDLDSDYTYFYDDETLEITITPTPPNLGGIYIAGYIIGEFIETLNMKEKIILAEGMCVPWLEEKRNKEELLSQSISTNDYKRTSQAEHIHQLNISLDNQYWKNVKSMINEYTFKQEPNSLLGLGGGLT